MLSVVNETVDFRSRDPTGSSWINPRSPRLQDFPFTDICIYPLGCFYWAWWYTQELQEFRVILCYTVSETSLHYVSPPVKQNKTNQNSTFYLKVLE